jgi:hypothetical protein
MITGKTITLEVETSTTIYAIKEMIQNKEGIPPSHQHLRFRGSMQLDYFRTLADYNIDDASTLYLTMQIFVKTLTGTPHRLYVFLSQLCMPSQ